jgi:hypothetical protein
MQARSEEDQRPQRRRDDCRDDLGDSGQVRVVVVLGSDEHPEHYICDRGQAAHSLMFVAGGGAPPVRNLRRGRARFGQPATNASYRALMSATRRVLSGVPNAALEELPASSRRSELSCRSFAAHDTVLTNTPRGRAHATRRSALRCWHRELTFSPWICARQAERRRPLGRRSFLKTTSRSLTLAVGTGVSSARPPMAWVRW